MHCQDGRKAVSSLPNISQRLNKRTYISTALSLSLQICPITVNHSY